MKLIRNLNIFMLSMIIFIVSCMEDKQEGVSSQEAKSIIETASKEMQVDIVDMIESEGITSLTRLQDKLDVGIYEEGLRSTQDTRKSIQTTIKELVRIGDVFLPNQRALDEGMTVEDVGVYVWNVELQYFELIDSEVNYLELQFPSAESDTNNAVFKIYEFDTKESGSEFLFSNLKAELTIDGVLVVSIDMEVDYDADDFVMEARADVFITPFEYYIEFNDNLPLVSSMNASISKDDLSIMSHDLNVTYTDLDKSEMSTVSGGIYYREIGVVGSVDVSSIVGNLNKEIDLNDYVELIVSSDDQKLGDIVIEGTLQDLDLLIIYSDGSSESLLDLMTPTIIEVEELLEEVEM